MILKRQSPLSFPGTRSIARSPRTLITLAIFTLDQRCRSAICSRAATRLVRAPSLAILSLYNNVGLCSRASQFIFLRPLPPTSGVLYPGSVYGAEPPSREGHVLRTCTLGYDAVTTSWCPCTGLSTSTKVPRSWMNFLVWNTVYAFPLFVPPSLLDGRRRRRRWTRWCVLLGIVYMCTCTCFSFVGGLNGFSTWSIVSRCLSFHSPCCSLGWFPFKAIYTHPFHSVPLCSVPSIDEKRRV